MISSDDLHKIHLLISNETFLIKYGSTWVVDSFYLFLITPSGYLGFILNMLSIFILYKIPSQQSTVLYKYLIVYCFNNQILCLTGGLSFYVYSSRYIGVKLDKFAKFYYCGIVNWVSITFYFFGNLLDIIINIERLSIFVKGLRKFTQINFLIACLVAFLISVIINVPSYLRIYIKNENETYMDLLENFNNISSIYSICGHGILNKNYILIGLNIFIRDILSLITEIILSLLTLKQFRNYKKNKSKLKTDTRRNGDQKSKDSDVKLTLMTCYLSLLSIISHSTLCLSFAFFYIESVIFQSVLTLISYLAIFLKHAYSFFIFYNFNSNFKNTFLNFINRANIKVNIKS
jgi:hypothetical protein